MKTLKLILFTIGTLVSIGQNTNAKTNPRYKWHARLPQDAADANKEQEMLCISDVQVVRSYYEEQVAGCHHRAEGKVCEFSDIPKGMQPVFLDGCYLAFHTRSKEKFGYAKTYVIISHLVVLPNGDSFGVVTGEADMSKI